MISATFHSDDFSCDHLTVRLLSGFEQVSNLYEIDIELVSRSTKGEELVLDPDDLVGSDGYIELSNDDGSLIRRIHGFIAEAREHADDETIMHPVYFLRFVPQAWRLRLVKTQEIFMDMTVPQIIEAKLARLDMDGYAEMRLIESYEHREFVVQYKETDLDFIQRLCEHVGISYHFEHGDDGEKMVFSDHQGGFPEHDDGLPWTPRGHGHGVFEISTSSRVVPRAHAVTDYNYRTPAVDVSAMQPLESGFMGGVVEYGAHIKTAEEAEVLARVRAEETQSGRRTYDGQSALPALTAGQRVHLDGHPRLEKASLLITRVEHDLKQAVGGEDSSTEDKRYRNRFSATPGQVRYRPARVTPRPYIRGVVSGIVQPGADGTIGGTAKLDEQGRYTVQFHFDTTLAGEQKASRPIRMAQPFAGHNEGMHFPLRPGTEVLLVFVDGDPDRPLIIGALPNPETPSPVTASNAKVNRIATSTGVLFEFGSGD